MSDVRPPTAAIALSSIALAVELARGGHPPAALLAVAATSLWYLAVRHGRAVWDERPCAVVFFASLAAYLSTFRWHGGDDLPNSLLPFAILRHGTMALNDVARPLLTDKLNDFTVTAGNALLSIFPVSSGILALPVYALPVFAGAEPTEALVHALSKTGGALITAASAAAFHRATAGKASQEWRLGITLLYALGSWAWSLSSQALWQAAPAQLGLAIGLMGLNSPAASGPAVAGFGFGLAAVSRPDHVFFLAASLGYALTTRRNAALGLAGGAAIPLGLTLAYWLAYTGKPLPPEWGVQSSLFPGFQSEAALALLVSPLRGLLPFFPAVLFALWAVRRRPEPLKLWLLGAAAALYVLVCCRTNWVGGQSFGPRYFSGVAILLAWFCVDLEVPIRRSAVLARLWGATLAANVMTHGLGAYFKWPGYGWHTESIEAAMWDWSQHPLAALVSSSGALRRLDPLWRWAIAACFVAAAVGVAAGSSAFLFRPAGGDEERDPERKRGDSSQA